MILLRVLLRLIDGKSQYEILEYRVKSMAYKVYVLHYDTLGQKTRNIPKEDIMNVKTFIEPDHALARIWCHEEMLEDAKILLKDNLEKDIDRAIEAIGPRLKRLNEFQSSLKLDPTVKRSTFEEWLENS